MTQTQVNDAVQRLLDGYDDTLQLIRDGVANGEITVRAGETGLHLRVMPPHSPIARALRELHTRAGSPTIAEVAEAVGVSEATVPRLFAGTRGGTWPTVRLTVEYLGGDPADYRPLWEETKRGARA